MDTPFTDALHTLQPGQTLRVHGGLGWTVAVFAGQLWLTQDGDLRDVYLGAGETFTLDVDAPALLHATRDTRFAWVQPARPARPRGLLARAWSALRTRVDGSLGARPLDVEGWPAAGARA